MRANHQRCGSAKLTLACQRQHGGGHDEGCGGDGGRGVQAAAQTALTLRPACCTAAEAQKQTDKGTFQSTGTSEVEML